MGLNPDVGRPERFILEHIAVPPLCIRPSIGQDNARCVLTLVNDGRCRQPQPPYMVIVLKMILRYSCLKLLKQIQKSEKLSKTVKIPKI